MLNPRDLIEQTTDLFSLPDVYFRVKYVIDNPNSGLQDIAREIAVDPGLTARLLRIANSPFFGLVATIESVDRAVNLLGMQQVHDLVLATSVTNAFGDVSEDHISMADFWSGSVYGGIISRLLAVRCNVLDSERLFVEGLLRDIGHLVMYQCIPKQTLQAKLFAEEEGTPVYQNERDIIGFDYAAVGAELIRAWHLPHSMCEAIEYHNEPSRAVDFPLEVAIAHISARIVEATMQTDSTALDLSGIDSHALDVTGLTPDTIESAVGEARGHASETLQLLIGNRAA